MILDVGELVCDAQYYSHLEEEKYWHTLSENWFTKVCLRHVLKTNIDMMDNTTDNVMHKTRHQLKTSYRRKGALKISEHDVEELIFDINRRDKIEAYDTIAADDDYNNNEEDDNSEDEYD